MNFSDMYDHVESVMVESKIAHKLERPQWVDRNGNFVEREEDSHGCKVEVSIDHPDCAIVMDEVGCNLSQDCDNRVGGELYLTGRKDEAYKSISTRHQHFTVLGLTSLDGRPVLCVVILSGKKIDIPSMAGIDWDAINTSINYDIEDGEEINFLRNNRGDGEIFPEGPVCDFKGKKIPTFVTSSESGGMDGFILTSILKHLDGLGLYEEERKRGITPFLLLDGHQSRFELEFLQYINDDETKWNTCIGVPYGTALWQVGDSSQQNGKFKILLTKKKRELFEKRLKSFCQHVHLLKSDIMILIRDTWMEAFGNIESNLKAIGDRGWNPLNKILLIHPIILATITESRIKFEMERKIFPSQVLQSLAMAAYIETNGTVLFSITNNHQSNPFNFNGKPIATHVANSIMAETDCEEARERNKLLKLEGRSIAEQVALITKKMTAGKLVLDGGSFHLDENVLQQAERRHFI